MSSADLKRNDSGSDNDEKVSIKEISNDVAVAVAPPTGLNTTTIVAAKESTDFEHKMTLSEGIKLYPRAILWSLLISMAVIMEGYDTIVIYNFFGFPPFQEKYGTLQPNGKYAISSAWQSGLSNASQVGSIIGLHINGWACDRFGYRRTFQVAIVFMTAFIAITFSAPNIQTLLVGDLLCGVPWGIFQTLTTAYAAELMPTALRPYLTTWVNCCWCIGQLLSSGVLRGLLNRSDKWAYKIPFAIQWVWCAPLLIGSIFMPESPWYLVRKGRPDDARNVLLRLTSRKNVNYDVDAQIANMTHTNELEKAISEGTSYKQCFSGVDRRRTEIAIGVWVIQAWCGSSLMGYSITFLESAGLSSQGAFNLNVGQFALGVAGTLTSWIGMRYFGRRSLYLGGLSILFFILFIVGCMGIPAQTTGLSWAVGGLLLAYTFVYDLTVGPVCYCLVAEVGSTRLRAKTVVLARNMYNIAGIITNVVQPRLIQTGKGNAGLGAKTGFFWAGACALCWIYTFFRIPEPRGRTYGELDVLFEKKVSARRFASTHVDQFGEDGVGHTRAQKEGAEIEHIA